MGNQPTTSQSKQFIQHERIGSTKIFQVMQKNQQGQNQQVPKMSITRSIQSKNAYDKWALQLRKINDSQGHQLFLVPQTHNFQKAGFCGSSGLITITFQKFEFVLSSQIKNRKILKKYFQQTEIWYVLYNLVRAGNKFQILKQKIGDIHPRNILINQDGQTAIITKFSIPDQSQNFQRYIEDQKAEIFLAPEQMKQQDLDKKVYNQKIDKCLAEVFSLGMTLLSAGTLQPCNQAYRSHPISLNVQKLNSLIFQFSKRYKPFLTNTLKSMLELDPSKRVRSKKLYEILSQYQSKILDLEPFQVYVQPQSQHGGYPVSFNHNQYNPQQFRPVQNQYPMYHAPNNPDTFHHGHGQQHVIVNQKTPYYGQPKY